MNQTDVKDGSDKHWAFKLGFRLGWFNKRKPDLYEKYRVDSKWYHTAHPEFDWSAENEAAIDFCVWTNAKLDEYGVPSFEELYRQVNQRRKNGVSR